MIPTAFEYRRAGSVAEALSLLQEGGPEAKLLAGGHSLIPMMKQRLAEPGLLIDIGGLDELRGIQETDGEIAIGAAMTHAEIAASDLLREQAPIVAETAAAIGDAQVRNRGTIGGSLAHADPGADLPAVMVALDATIAILGSNGERKVQAEDFFQDILTVDLAEDEIVTGVCFQACRSAAYAKLEQRASKFALVGVAAALSLDGGTCSSARVAVTGASSHAQRLSGVEGALAGASLPDGAADAAAGAGDALDFVNEDLHGSEEYRRAMTAVFARARDRGGSRKELAARLEGTGLDVCVAQRAAADAPADRLAHALVLVGAVDDHVLARHQGGNGVGRILRHLLPLGGQGVGRLQVAAQPRLAPETHAILLRRRLVDKHQRRRDEVLRAPEGAERARAELGPAVRPVDVHAVAAQLLEDEVPGEGRPQDLLAPLVEGVVAPVARAPEHIERVPVADGELHQLDVVGGLVRVHACDSRGGRGPAARPAGASGGAVEGEVDFPEVEELHVVELAG